MAQLKDQLPNRPPPFWHLNGQFAKLPARISDRRSVLDMRRAYFMSRQHLSHGRCSAGYEKPKPALSAFRAAPSITFAAVESKNGTAEKSRMKLRR